MGADKHKDNREGFEVINYTDRDLFLMNPRHYNTIVVDEVHYVKNPTAVRSRLVCGLVRRIGKKGRTISLSGTLVPNRPIELWPLLFSTRITTLSYEKFAYRYANAFIDEWNDLDVTGASNVEELAELIRPHTIRYTRAEVLPDLPLSTWRVLALDLPLGKREKDYSLRELKRCRDAVAREAMSVILKEHGKRKLVQVIQHVKDALEAESKVVVFAHHREVIEGLRTALALYHPVHLWGGMSDRAKDRAVTTFRKDQECRVFIGQLQAAGVGVDGLQYAASRVIFAEGSWVPSDLLQAVGRLQRLGQRYPVLVDLLTIHKYIDEAMLRRALEKSKVIERILPSGDPAGR